MLPPRPLQSVLVVEDEPRLRDLLVGALPDMGFPAHGCRSAEDALRLMDAEPRDILLIDLNLPGMDGLEFLKRAREHWPHVQAIILTGHGDLPAAQQAIRLQAVDFLTKPCPLDALEQAMERARRARWDLYQQQLQAHQPDDLPEDASPAPQTAPVTLEEVERQHILQALARNDGNRTLTAQQLGISRRMLQYRIAQYQREGWIGD